MAGYKRSRGGRRVMKRVKRRRTRGRRSFGRRRKLNNSTVYSFKRRWIGNPILPIAGGSSANGATTFSLSNVRNASEFGNLFDQYMITHATITFTLIVDTGAQIAANATIPTLYWCNDFDDSTPPPDANELRERQGCKIRYLRPGVPVTCRVKPACLDQVYRSTVATAYSPQWRQWVDCSTMDVPHYGIKWFIDNMFTTALVKAEQCLWFKCKGLR